VQTSRGALAHTLLAVLAALTLGGILLSLWTAPPEAVYQLRLAARATEAASGFVITDTASVTPLLSGLPASTQHQLSGHTVTHIVYQAPDRVGDQSTSPAGLPVTVVVIGSTRYQLTAGRWYELPPSRSRGLSAADVVLFPLRAASGSSEVVRQDGQYLFLPVDLDRFTTMFFRSHVAQLSSVSVTAEVHGDYLTRERITAVHQDSRYTVDLVFTSIGAAPPVEAPPPSQIVHLPLGGAVR
jgi:hypothetical protein